jgi:hypothetical protein
MLTDTVMDTGTVLDTVTVLREQKRKKRLN